MLSSLSSLEQYFLRYGTLLGRKAVGAVNPIYSPARDQSFDLGFLSQGELRIKPYPCQANVINAVARAWMKQLEMIICGEMGTGKTLLGAAAVHANATIVRGRPTYRALIMCPNHLIDKWEEEILEVIPGAHVYKFSRSDENAADDSYKQVAAYIQMCKGVTKAKAGKGGHSETCDVSTGVDQFQTVTREVPGPARRSARKTWTTPPAPEWVIIGRNQAKQAPGWSGFGENPKTDAGCRKTKRIGERAVCDLKGHPIVEDGEPVMEVVRAKVTYCPKCGSDALSSDAVMWERQTACEARVLQELGDPESKAQGLDTLCPIPVEFARTRVGTVVKHERRDGKARRWKVVKCGQPLWQYVPKPRKWTPAMLIHRQGRKMFDYFLLDEMHEERGEATAQAVAAGKMMKSARRVLGLTGTLIGGFAHHLFPILMRMSPASLVEEGYEWGDGKNDFSDDYGRIDTIMTTKLGGESKPSRGGQAKGATSIRKSYDGDTATRREVKPGVMPSFFGKHLIEKSVFISLDEMSHDLPDLIDDDRSLVPVAMNPEQQAEFDRVQERLVSANTELLLKGSTKLLSAMLHTLLEYPDQPFGWEGPFPGSTAVGYWHESERPKNEDNWHGVVQPADLAENVVYPKEQALFDICHREACEGRQVWVFCTMTCKRDVQERLAGILEAGGLKVKIMRSGSVDPMVRRQWIAEHAPHHHVIISHPELVSTGLDFFDKRDWTFNYATIVFYEGDYRVDLIRQAGHRHWRIGQKVECRTYYLYYEGTMQERQVLHVGEKLAAAKSLEGKFSAEGLAAMSSGGSPMTQMAKALSTKIENPREAWSKLRVEVKAKLVDLHERGVLAVMEEAAGSEPGMSDLMKTFLSSGPLIDPDALTLSADAIAMLDQFDPAAMLASLARLDVNVADLVK